MIDPEEKEFAIAVGILEDTENLLRLAKSRDGMSSSGALRSTSPWLL